LVSLFQCQCSGFKTATFSRRCRRSTASCFNASAAASRLQRGYADQGVGPHIGFNASAAASRLQQHQMVAEVSMPVQRLQDCNSPPAESA